MQLSLFLAKVLGLSIVIVFVSLLYHKNVLKSYAVEASKNIPFVYFTGIIGLLLGLMMVVSHNIWEWNYRGVVTVFGWLILIKGLIRLFWPQFIQKIIKNAFDSWWLQATMFLCFVIGIYLLYEGFFQNNS